MFNDLLCRYVTRQDRSVRTTEVMPLLQTRGSVLVNQHWNRVTEADEMRMINETCVKILTAKR